MYLSNIVAPSKISKFDDDCGVIDLRTPFEIYVLRCCGKIKNQWSELPTAKVFFFNTRSKKVIKTTCFNEKAIIKDNNAPEQGPQIREYPLNHVYYDFSDDICFLIAREIHFVKKINGIEEIAKVNSELGNIEEEPYRISKNKYVFLGCGRNLQVDFEIIEIGKEIKISRHSYPRVGTHSQMFDNIIPSMSTGDSDLFILSSNYCLIRYDLKSSQVEKNAIHTFPITQATLTRVGSEYVVGILEHNLEILTIWALKKRDGDDEILSLELLSMFSNSLDLFPENRNSVDIESIHFPSVRRIDESTEILQFPVRDQKLYNTEFLIKDGSEVKMIKENTRQIFPEKLGDGNSILEIPEWNLQVAAGVSKIPGDD